MMDVKGEAERGEVRGEGTRVGMAEGKEWVQKEQEGNGKGPPEVRYASKPVCPGPRKPLPAPPLWSPSPGLPMRTSCVPEPLRVGARV